MSKPFAVIMLIFSLFFGFLGFSAGKTGVMLFWALIAVLALYFLFRTKR
jgi:hypothetical protein